ncbi:galactose-specific adhesin 170kd subunit [Entamoeba histolytica]|uniref:Galactose-specific adhesin 170kD subunit n=3 Tax=Entamoeba histolytica TaxID=5759 RepID=C4M8N3_ENTH1|nr:galactose-specific adhesin 170kD subunit [Entamoeba histolytica HM-1:IMSS]EAL50029.2 galactose-specific adhesin 170kD subunit [Entamoeba histolytica HM-1:IMSS]GAT97971.1 galactose-specific adhesin 170kd subunit [Entamoeba histolytica]|eukprot:XP_655415.2 galactose-specific adhesin 170kD subunit [Entamoeba histolytica HM-1:IMSS]
MKLLLLNILLLCCLADKLNEFSADIDYYDLGIMSRGKNAGSWYHSYTHQYDVFYYLAMQPWRHFVWTTCDKNDNTECYKYTINEDHNVKVEDINKTNIKQDFCQKEYAYPIEKYEVDWDNVPVDEQRIESVDINGKTCFKYAAKRPLAYVYLNTKMTYATKTEAYDVCRMDFIGGRSITFRSFNTENKAFIDQYNTNTTSKCLLDVYKNNVNTHLAIIFGITDSTVIKSLQENLSLLSQLKTVKGVTLYYLKDDTYFTVNITLDQLKYDTLVKYTAGTGQVDPLINIAKKDLATKVADKSKDKNANDKIKRGTMIVLMDTALGSEFNAETEFDRKNISVHTVVLNRNKDPKITRSALRLVSLGPHYHEFTGNDEVNATITALFKGIRANLTERCDRDKCSGFCDAMNRCTCPMCCENDCFYTSCDVETGSCIPWPKAKPKAKKECPATCVGSYECRDLEGCVVKQYNTSCEPKVKCMVPYCDNDKNLTEVCKQKANCEADQKPSSDGYCWSYTCDQTTGFCKKDKRGENMCTGKTNNCQEYVCDEKQRCSVRDKVCVKTSPYIEMSCYVAKCNLNTGMCENRLSCDTYSSCGGDSTGSVCKCDSTTNNQCQCTQVQNGNYCDSNKHQICDYTGTTPKCKVSNCTEDLVRDGCLIKRCNETSKTTYWENVDCSKTEVKFAQDGKSENMCKQYYSTTCLNGKCVVQAVGDVSNVGCGYCSMGTDNIITYHDDCNSRKSQCGNFNGKCVQAKDKSYSCVFEKDASSKSDNDICAKCSSLTCPADTTYRTYTYDSKTGTCKATVQPTPACSVCESGKFVEKCKDQKLERKVTLENGKEYKYTIPKDCVNEQCIPRTYVDCLGNDDNFKSIYNFYLPCQAYVTATYHYSSLFNLTSYKLHLPQSEEFMKEADKEAYCTYEITTRECKTCSLIETREKVQEVDLCAEETKNGGVPFKCKNNNCIIDPNFDCQPIECKIQEIVITEKDGIKTTTCKNTTKTTCDTNNKRIEDARKAFIEGKEGIEQVECASTVCQNDNSCPIITDVEKCNQNTEVDYGCKAMTGECDGTTYLCKFVQLTDDPSLDSEHFRTKSGVELNNACLKYKCVESKGSDGKITHKWEIDTERSNANPKPRNPCETATCNQTTGETIYTKKTCTVSEEFPTITPNQGRCFYCQCSYLDGSSVLTMYGETDKEYYDLDACGNCRVWNQTDRTQQLNNHTECILAGEINNVGAIAAATTVAAVIVAVVVALIVVSIGLFKTYQLVSSAMKNAITTTNENAEYVGADNEATNAAIFNG